MATPKKSAGKKASKKTAKKATRKAASKKTAKKATRKAAKKTAKKATAKKTARKTPSKKTAKKATRKAAKKTARSTSARASEPSMRSAAAKAREAAGDVQYVVKKQVQDLLKNLDMRTDNELIHEVNQRVRDMLTSAADRAKRNERDTVKPHDL